MIARLFFGLVFIFASTLTVTTPPTLPESSSKSTITPWIKNYGTRISKKQLSHFAQLCDASHKAIESEVKVQHHINALAKGIGVLRDEITHYTTNTELIGQLQSMLSSYHTLSTERTALFKKWQRYAQYVESMEDPLFQEALESLKSLVQDATTHVITANKSLLTTALSTSGAVLANSSNALGAAGHYYTQLSSAHTGAPSNPEHDLIVMDKALTLLGPIQEKCWKGIQSLSPLIDQSLTLQTATARFFHDFHKELTTLLK